MAWSSGRCGASPGCSNTSANLSHNAAYYESIAFSPSFWPSQGCTTTKKQSNSGSAQSSQSQALAETSLARMEPGTMLASTATVQESSTNNKVFWDQSTCGLYLRKKSIPNMTSVVSYGKTLATISKEHGAESLPLHTQQQMNSISGLYCATISQCYYQSLIIFDSLSNSFGYCLSHKTVSHPRIHHTTDHATIAYSFKLQQMRTIIML